MFDTFGGPKVLYVADVPAALAPLASAMYRS
jgi:hypothetical protein